MHKLILSVLALGLIAGIMTSALAEGTLSAGSEADFKATLARAQAANDEAGRLKNQWTTAAQVLADASRAAAAGEYGKAVELARHAESLARASIKQAQEQQEMWKATAALIR